MELTFTNKNLVACTPFPKQSVEKVIKGGIAMIDKKVTLQELSVVFSNLEEGLDFGHKVFIRGDQVVQPWAKEVFTINGKDFILVPVSAIQLVVKNG